MERERSILFGVLGACALLGALAHWATERAPDPRVLAARDEGAHLAAARSVASSGDVAGSARVALALVRVEAAAPAAIHAPAPAELEQEAVAPVRAPELAGLLLDSSASEARLRAWYAPATDEDLARANFRLERLLELAKARPEVLLALVHASTDADGVERERAHVAERLAQLPASPLVLAALATQPGDANAEFAARYQARSVEDLAIAAWRVRRALEFAQQDAIELAYACGDYALVQPSTGWG